MNPRILKRLIAILTTLTAFNAGVFLVGEYNFLEKLLMLLQIALVAFMNGWVSNNNG